MTSAREVIARALLIHDEPKARFEDQSASEQEKYQTEAKWFERYLEAEGLVVQTADEVEARIAEAVAARDAENARLRRVLKQCYDSLGMLDRRVSEKAQMLRTDINIVIRKGE